MHSSVAANHIKLVPCWQSWMMMHLWQSNPNDHSLSIQLNPYTFYKQHIVQHQYFVNFASVRADMKSWFEGGISTTVMWCALLVQSYDWQRDKRREHTGKTIMQLFPSNSDAMWFSICQKKPARRRTYGVERVFGVCVCKLEVKTVFWFSREWDSIDWMLDCFGFASDDDAICQVSITRLASSKFLVWFSVKLKCIKNYVFTIQFLL